MKGILRFTVAVVIGASVIPAVAQTTIRANGVTLDKGHDFTEQQNETRSSLDTVFRTLGRGYNTFTHVYGGECVDGQVLPPRQHSFAPSYSIRLIRSYEEYTHETAAEASASGSFASFSASVKAKFQEATASSSRREFLLVRERVVASPEINLQSPRMRVMLPAENDPAGQAKFFRQCGNEFISKVTVGGELVAVVNFSESDSSRHSSFELSASGSGWSVSTEAEFNTKLSNLRKETAVQISAVQIGGRTSQLPQLNVDAFITYARNFPGQIGPETAVLLKVDPEPYWNLDHGTHAPDFRPRLAQYDAVKASSLRATNWIHHLQDTERALAKYAIPAAGYPNDVHQRMEAQIAAAQKDYHDMVAALTACGNNFWVAQQCVFDHRYLDYRTPPGPVFVKKINLTKPERTTFDIPTDMHVELRGQNCNARINHCAHDGVIETSSPQNGLLKMMDDVHRAFGLGPILIKSATAENVPYSGKPVPVSKGRVEIWAQYANDQASGDLYAFVY